MSENLNYLQSLEEKINALITQLKEADPDAPVSPETQALLKELIETETELRKNYDIGGRFNVLKTQLESLLHKIESNLAERQKKELPSEIKLNELKPSEILVYVYLFNAQGGRLNTWSNLLTQNALNSHAIHRPIYSEKSHIDALLRTKAQRDYHGYLEIKIKKDDITKKIENKDPNGRSLLKLRENALKVENIQAFYYLHQKYLVDKKGNLVTVG